MNSLLSVQKSLNVLIYAIFPTSSEESVHQAIDYKKLCITREENPCLLA